MTTCTVEAGFLRKKPCGHVAIAKCLNCDQPLCIDHAVAQLSEAGHRTGKFMCKECSVAAKEQAKTLAAIERKHGASGGSTHHAPAASHAAPKAPAAHAPASAPAAKAPEALDALEFTPKDGKKKN